MNAFVNGAMQVPDSVTENGAATFASSLNANVDLFFQIGASRGQAPKLLETFRKAYNEDPFMARRIALWARDVRGGAGEREAFRQILKWLEKNVPDHIFQSTLNVVPEYGRWDDLFVVENEVSKQTVAALYKHALMTGNGLAAKWAPRKGEVSLWLRYLMGMSPKNYRKTIVNLSNTVEQKMCAKEWDGINFAHVPSVAAARYNKAFWRNAKDTYEAYKNALVKGETKINASSIFPHDVVRTARAWGTQKDVVDAQWNSLPNYLGDNGNILVMSDVSGSMQQTIGGTATAMDVSIALGLYISERQKGPFKDVVLTFSGNPKFHKVTGKGITERVQNLNNADWAMNTDLNKAFKLILDVAVKNNVPAQDMPTMLLILSDMEFDACGGDVTNFQALEKMYTNAGYAMPKVTFWNLAARSKNVPVRAGQHGTALVSGFSPAILGSILGTEAFTPENVMLNAVMVQRYDVPHVTVPVEMMGT